VVEIGSGAGFGQAMDQGQAFVDFEPYAPSNDVPAAFIARRVERDGQVIGVLALQMPIGRINEVMQVTAGMGETGETYVVGPDHLMHSDSRFSETSTILKTRVDTDTAGHALAGRSGVAVVDDYRGVPVLSAYQPFAFGGTTWAVMAEIDLSEVDAPIQTMRNSVIFIGLGLTLLVALGGVALASSITRPLAELSRSITHFRQTREPVDLSRFSRRDEIGDIARGFQSTAQEVADYITGIDEAHRELARGQERLAKAYNVISDSIEYASHIQRSLLPRQAFLAEDLREHFVIWQPRDVVGGDLYWYRRCNKGFILVLADCTGHGVPGGFMTMLSSGALDRALREQPDGDPARLLALMNHSIRLSLGQDHGEGESDDGLQLGICRVEYDLGKLVFAGARFSLFRANGGAIEEIKGDRTGIGYRHVADDYAFRNRMIVGEEGDTFYMLSDGLIDQIGGTRRRAFGKRRLTRLLAAIHAEPLAGQKTRIEDAFAEFQGDEARRDDVTVIGFRI